MRFKDGFAIVVVGGQADVIIGRKTLRNAIDTLAALTKGMVETSHDESAREVNVFVVSGASQFWKLLDSTVYVDPNDELVARALLLSEKSVVSA